MKTVLLFNIQTEKRERVLFLLNQLGLSFREIPEVEQRKSIAELCGRGPLPPLVQGSISRFSEEMLVMDSLDSPQFHGLLDGLRGLKATIPLKAVVTTQNLCWSAAALFEALREEHARLS